MLSQQHSPQGKHRGANLAVGSVSLLWGWAWVCREPGLWHQCWDATGMLPVSVLWLGLGSSWKLDGAVLH